MEREEVWTLHVHHENMSFSFSHLWSLDEIERKSAGLTLLSLCFLSESNSSSKLTMYIYMHWYVSLSVD